MDRTTPPLRPMVGQMEPTVTTEREKIAAAHLAVVLRKQSNKTRIMKFALSTLIIVLVVFMVWIVYWPSHYGFNDPLSKTDLAVNGFYYWATVTSTVGFGDICPKTNSAKLFTAFYQIFLGTLGFGILWELTDETLEAHRDSINKILLP